jgi:homodimeric-type pyruvate dehydrogenase E1 component
MVFAKLLRNLLRDPEWGRRIVPIIPDEARTFGMEVLFREIGIYAPFGQKYDPVDSKLVLSYTEKTGGQLLEEGITEAGSMASFTAAGTSYATHGEAMIPFYIFYSMFGFQRTGDFAWAFGDARGKGFMLGATAGRTTLNGEGLQHEDGHSHVLASTIPSIKAYDPAFAFEVATIIRSGLDRMYVKGEDIYYYLTLYNQDYQQPPMPSGVEDGIVRGMYLYRGAVQQAKHRAQLFGSGISMLQALRAQEILAQKFEVAADVWSVTSYQQLRNEALECERWNRLHAGEPEHVPYVARQLENAPGPVIAVTDYMKSVPDMVSRWIHAASPRSAPTASAGATRARRSAASSRWTPSTSSSRRCRLGGGRPDHAGRRGAGDPGVRYRCGGRGAAGVVGAFGAARAIAIGDEHAPGQIHRPGACCFLHEPRLRPADNPIASIAPPENPPCANQSSKPRFNLRSSSACCS